MRFAWYAGASTALAGGVVLSAFYQRSNFYSAMVHLSQSSISILILVNLIYLIYGSFVYGLQRLCYGPLRPIEIEQLYEKAWIAVTETCLAMTIFREEVGAFFLLMFTALVTGKIWGWIGEGRVDIVEQQPPAASRLLHTRLSISLLVSVTYDIWLLAYAVRTVIQQARPNMMVMFLFEFAILTVCSFHTVLRYIFSLVEGHVIKQQTHQMLLERRRHIAQQRADILHRREAGQSDHEGPLPSEDDVDEMDIEVPGWETKGLWVLSLDLLADFLKLAIYATFFGVLLTFYGLPVHIMRDLFMTTRSFIKRLGALLRYRQAVRDMDRYPDASRDDLAREDTCIVCREEMRPWDPDDTTQVARSRPKKLPCGHVLHLGCLRSWLERQQACPICRRPVAIRNRQAPPQGNAMGLNFRFGLPMGANPDQAAAAGQAGQNAPPRNAGQPEADANRGAIRMLNLGPLRVGIAHGRVQDLPEMVQRLGLPRGVLDNPAAAAALNPHAAPLPQPTAPVATAPVPRTSDLIYDHLAQMADQVRHDILSLRHTAHQLGQMTQVLQELDRLRHTVNEMQLSRATNSNGHPQGTPDAAPSTTTQPRQPPQHSSTVSRPMHFTRVPATQNPSFHTTHAFPTTTTAVTRHGGSGPPIPAGSPDLPPGVTIPAGWSLLPLQRLDNGVEPTATSAVNDHSSNIATQEFVRSLPPQVIPGHLQPHTSHPVDARMDRLAATSNPRVPNATSSGHSTSQFSPISASQFPQFSPLPRNQPGPAATPTPHPSNQTALAQSLGGEKAPSEGHRSTSSVILRTTESPVLTPPSAQEPDVVTRNTAAAGHDSESLTNQQTQKKLPQHLREEHRDHGKARATTVEDAEDEGAE